MRDVIQVERAGDIADGSGNIAELARVADELLPPLVARLGVSDLGEIEVRQGTWRVRIRRVVSDPHPQAAPAAAAHAPAAAAHAPAAATHAASAPAHPTAAPDPTDRPAATSTAVGYFALKSGLAVGHRVARGDLLGWVDVLGVRKEIVSPTDGVISRFVTEPGDPVEYGQELVRFIAATGAGTAKGAVASGPGSDTPPDAPAADAGAPAGPA
jgi:biotin carboxyl carrier protein